MKYDIVDGKTVGEIRYGANGVLSLYMRYIFDEAGSVTGIGIWTAGSDHWTDYYFVKNLQGDVVEVYDTNNTLAASYTYDAWGNILTKSGDLADLNPFRYRTYYFDNETWFYYLQSRYYDPAIGRFINADILYSTGQGLLGNNMFTYCLNNPINGCDPCGTCFHRRDFWNDCAKCGGKTIRDKWNDVTAWCADAYNTISSTNQQIEMLNTQIIMKQNELIATAAETTWNAYMHYYDKQHEAQLMEAQMMAAVTPRIIKSGFEAGIDVAIGTAVSMKIENSLSSGEPKSVATAAAIGFAGGFVAGACKEIWRIVLETIAAQ